MSTSLGRRMAALRRDRRPAFVPFLTAGYPDLPTFRALVRRTGSADVLEIGLPFSDPVADGPTICRASDAALAQGMHCDLLFDLLAAERDHPPVVVMTYLNPLLAYGVDAFLGRARGVGVEGLLVTDLPPDEAGEVQAAAARHGVATVQLVAPTTTAERIRAIAATTTGFLYCVALAGTTGARAALAAGARDTVARVRQVTALPVVVGFGIATPEHVREVCRFADGAVVGSALLDFVATHRQAPDLADLFSAHLAALADAAHAAS